LRWDAKAFSIVITLTLLIIDCDVPYQEIVRLLTLCFQPRGFSVTPQSRHYDPKGELQPHDMTWGLPSFVLIDPGTPSYFRWAYHHIFSREMKSILAVNMKGSLM
jgi:hypothetical protein